MAAAAVAVAAMTHIRYSILEMAVEQIIFYLCRVLFLIPVCATFSCWPILSHMGYTIRTTNIAPSDSMSVFDTYVMCMYHLCANDGIKKRRKKEKRRRRRRRR